MVVLALIAIQKMLPGRDGDLHSYFYVASRLMLDGTWSELGPQALAYTALPVALVPIMILAMLPYLVAAVLWSALSVAFLALAAPLAAGRTAEAIGARGDAAAVPVIASLGVAFIAASVVVDLNLGQMDLLATLLLVLALHWFRIRPVACGLCLAAASTMKFVGLLYLPWLLLRRAWWQAGALVVGFIGMWAVMIPFLGIEVSSAGLQRALGVSGRLDFARESSISTGESISAAAGLQRIVEPISPSLVSWAVPGLLVVVGLIGIGLYRAYRLPLVLRRVGASRALDMVEFACIPALAVAVASTSHARHGCMALMATCVLAALLVSPGRAALRVCMTIVAAGLVMAEARVPDALGLGQAWQHMGGFGWTMLMLVFAVVWGVLARLRSCDQQAMRSSI